MYTSSGPPARFVTSAVINCNTFPSGRSHGPDDVLVITGPVKTCNHSWEDRCDSYANSQRHRQYFHLLFEAYAHELIASEDKKQVDK